MTDGSGWGNPIAGGTVLRIPALQSPNFVHGTSGWAIFQDGTAEFNSITLPTGSGGATIFVQGTAPTAHHVNDMWVNTASGNVVETWNGSAWVSQQFGTGAIQANAITAALIAANTITAAQIASGTITATQIAAGTITSTQIASNTITASNIAAAAGILGTQLLNGTLTTTQLAAAAGILGAQIAAGTITGGSGGNIAATTITAANIAANTITAAQIAANTITASQIAAHTITAGQIAANTITATEIASHTITAAQILAATITTSEIAANTITASNIAANTITAGQIAANTITASQIAANTITAGQIAANSITEATLAAWAVDGVISQAAFHGLNMIPDPQFSNSGVNTARTSDPITAGSWTLSGGQAQATNVNGSANILALMSSTAKPIWVNPGETYYYSVTVNRSGASTNQIGIQFTGVTSITEATTASGTTTLSGTFTIPSGWKQMYVRIFANSSATADVITWSSPVLQPASLFSPTITGGTINAATFNGTNWVESAAGSFFYSGTPALGNLIGSSIPGTSNTTDGFGNNVYPGNCLYQASGGATATLVMQMYNGILSVGTPASILGTGGAAPAQLSGNTTNGVANLGSGLTATGDTLASLSLLSKNSSGTPAVALMTVSAALNLLGGADPVLGSSGGFIWENSAGSVKAATRQGFGGALLISQSDTTSFTITGTGFSAVTNTYTIPVNDAQAGTVYRLKVYGTGAQGSTQQLIGLHVVGFGNTEAATGWAATVIPASASYFWEAEATIIIKSTGVSGTAHYALHGQVSQTGRATSTTATPFSQANTSVTINTTVSNTIVIEAAVGSTTGAPTISGYSSTLERLGA